MDGKFDLICVNSIVLPNSNVQFPDSEDETSEAEKGRMLLQRECTQPQISNTQESLAFPCQKVGHAAGEATIAGLYQAPLCCA